jgi:hypothetical protein
MPTSAAQGGQALLVASKYQARLECLCQYKNVHVIQTAFILDKSENISVAGLGPFRFLRRYADMSMFLPIFGQES